MRTFNKFLENPTNQLIIAFLTLLGVLLLFSCNPVKMVLKDEKKFLIVSNEAIKRGLCTNDTTIITDVDSLIVHDTIVKTDIIIEVKNDTTYFWEVKYKDIFKTKIITQKVNSIVVDSSAIRLYKQEIVGKNIEIKNWKEKHNKLKIYTISLGLISLISVLALIAVLKR